MEIYELTVCMRHPNMMSNNAEITQGLRMFIGMFVWFIPRYNYTFDGRRERADLDRLSYLRALRKYIYASEGR